MKDSIIKVVPITPPAAASSQQPTPPMMARLPAPFSEMKDGGKQELKSLLRLLFDNIDDALFELADRAEHNAEQNLFFESMREIRIKRRGMELGFGKAIDEAFGLLLVDPPALKGDVASLDKLSLVGEDELEELVAADSMVAKAENEFSIHLKQLTARLDTLISPRSVVDSNNPFGPRVICNAFIAVSKTLEIDIKAKLVLFKLFDRYVMSSLAEVYSCCNEVLISAGILPVNKVAAGHQPVAGSISEPVEQAIDSTQVFADLQQLLRNKPDTLNTTATNGLVSPGQAPQIPNKTLMLLLQAVQKNLQSTMDEQLQASLQGQGPEQLNIQQSLGRLLAAKMPNKAVSIGQVDNDAINLVALLFQFILDDRNLAAPMKALIARLQIPIIKVAMQDKSFFSKGGHPARKLLNEIANTSLGWVPVVHVDRDPFYNKVSEIINKILAEFEGDSDIFNDALTDFIAFQEMEKRRIGLVEQRTINAEDGKAKSEQARNQVQNALNAKVAGKSLPKVVIEFLEQAWSNVLFLIYLKEGEGEHWQQSLQLVDDLLWSVEPLDTNDDRQKLMALLPSLLQSLRAGLTQISYNPFDMSQLFSELEMIHLGQLKQFNRVKLDVSEQKEVADDANSREEMSRQTQVIEKTLDQVLEQRVGDGVSLEQLDAELDEQLAKFDALGDLVAESTEDSLSVNGQKQLQVEDAAVTASSSDESDALSRQVVEKLSVGGASEEKQAPVETLPDDDPDLLRVDTLTSGSWVELHQEDGKKFKCRLAAIIRSTSKYIFVNRAGMKVAEYQRMSLAYAIKEGVVSTLDEGLLFDRALESVIGNLRSIKTSNV